MKLPNILIVGKNDVLPKVGETRYQEHHFKGEDIGVAWTNKRVWVCLDGQSIFRAKLFNGKLMIEFTEPLIKGTK